MHNIPRLFRYILITTGIHLIAFFLFRFGLYWYFKNPADPIAKILEAETDDAKRIEMLYKICFGRYAAENELTRAADGGGDAGGDVLRAAEPREADANVAGRNEAAAVKLETHRRVRTFLHGEGVAVCDIVAAVRRSLEHEGRRGGLSESRVGDVNRVADIAQFDHAVPLIGGINGQLRNSFAL